MTWFLAWLLAVEAAGVAALPLAVRLLRPLPDRGFLIAKPLGILLAGYVCWLLGVLGVLRFQRTTVIAVLLLAAAALWLAWGRDTLKQLAGARTVVVVLEGVFILALAASALIRAFNPDISGTEKPMDFAFLNSVARSETLPPEDPWLSGSSISYYYFGYYLLGLITKLSAVPASIGYNLSVALVFALLLAGSYSIAFNILSALRPEWGVGKRLVAALLAPVVVGVMGNLEVALEILATQGYSNPGFWQWAGIKNLQPAAHPGSGLFPSDFWWWWRASRIIPTTKPDGINEFPYFSFLLGDLHPHFTAAPWALLAVAVSLAAALRRAVVPEGTSDWPSRLCVALALGFLLVGNSWDFPAYTGLYWLAVLVPVVGSEWRRSVLITRAKDLLLVSAISVGLYAPFFLGFSSQTRGIGLSADRTPLASLLTIFGAVLLGLGAFLAWRGWSGDTESAGRGRLSRPLVLAGAFMVLVSAVAGSLAMLAGVLLLGVAAVLRFYRTDSELDRARVATLFHLLLAGVGLGLVLVPEFVFINDLFGTRMNTVFKFHYQAWILLGIAAAVGVVWFAGDVRSWLARVGALIPFTLLVCIGLLYPVAATLSKTGDFKSPPTLDGAAFYQSLRPDDYAAIQWLARNAAGRPVVLEATGGAYTEYARVSTFSGLPTVLGWSGHEAQWGRNGSELQQRTQDIDAIYSTASRDTILSLLQKYEVQYVFVGSLEAEKYGPAVAERFTGLLEPAYRQGRAAIYMVPATASRGQ